MTGSVSRGVADDVSDVEMLLVTRDQLDLDTCFALAAAAGLERLGSWGPQGPRPRGSPATSRGPLRADLVVARLRRRGDHRESPAADAIANGVSLRTCGLLDVWRERLAHYPDELAAGRIEDAALTWGGFAAQGSDDRAAR